MSTNFGKTWNSSKNPGTNWELLLGDSLWEDNVHSMETHLAKEMAEKKSIKTSKVAIPSVTTWICLASSAAFFLFLTLVTHFQWRNQIHSWSGHSWDTGIGLRILSWAHQNHSQARRHIVGCLQLSLTGQKLPAGHDYDCIPKDWDRSSWHLDFCAYLQLLQQILLMVGHLSLPSSSDRSSTLRFSIQSTWAAMAFPSIFWVSIGAGTSRASKSLTAKLLSWLPFRAADVVFARTRKSKGPHIRKRIHYFGSGCIN